MSTELITDDAILASMIAVSAGEVLLAVQRSGLVEGKALGAAGDAIAQAFIERALATQRPDDAVLSEEAASSADRLGRSRVWIVDPLDGTREYTERRDDWAVHIALSVEGEARLGAVALPGLGRVFSTDTPPQAAGPVKGAPRMLVSRTRPAPQAVAVAGALGAQLVPLGSAGAKAMAVIRGEADIYLHAGGQYEWDSCAPVAVAAAAGLHVSRIDGSACRYNNEDPYMPDLLICRPEWAGPVLEAVAKAGATAAVA